jgi:crotonobetainyl-CoA:carnitine CoA-transferase CaiB-like acyl-CoA transferase
MPGPMDGIRVVEVAAWTFVPAAGAVLADWGADVIKVEHPVKGDPQRGLATMGVIGADGVDTMVELPNRSKRSIGLDLSSDRGRELLMQVVETSDVFLTSYLRPVRRKLGIDVEQVRAHNPAIIYARGSGQGPRGEDADVGGFDGASYWARGGVGLALTDPSANWPVGQTPAFGDLQGSMNLVAGISAALLKRALTGMPSVVDVSLLATAMWALGPSIATAAMGDQPFDVPGREEFPNPLVNSYKSSDGRVIQLIMLESDRYWPELCERLGRSELIDDPRFRDASSRFEHRRACVAELDLVFGSRPVSDWREALDGAKGVWAVFQSPAEVVADPQVAANDYLVEFEARAGGRVRLPGPPTQFDETSPDCRPAPEHGQHTEEVLLELGLDWVEIGALKSSGAVL